MLSDYIISNEITEKGKIAQSNISMAIKKSIRGVDFLKYGGSIFIHKNISRFPDYIKKIIRNNNFMDFKGLVPLTFIENLFELKLVRCNNRFFYNNKLNRKYNKFFINNNSNYKIKEYNKFFIKLNSDFFCQNDKKIKIEISEIKKLHNKSFLRYNKEFHEILSNDKLIKTIVHYKDLPGLIKDDLILGYYDVSSRKKLVWYKF